MRPTPRPARPAGSDGSIADDEAAVGEAGSSGSGDGGSSGSGKLQPLTEDQAKMLDPDIELKRAMSEQAAWGGQPPVASTGTAAAAAATAAAGGSSGSSGSSQPAEAAGQPAKVSSCFCT